MLPDYRICFIMIGDGCTLGPFRSDCTTDRRYLEAVLYRLLGTESVSDAWLEPPDHTGKWERV